MLLLRVRAARRLTAGENFMVLQRLLVAVGETANTFLGFYEGLFGLPMCYTPPVKNPANPWMFVQTECRPNLDL